MEHNDQQGSEDTIGVRLLEEDEDQSQQEEEEETSGQQHLPLPSKRISIFKRVSKGAATSWFLLALPTAVLLAWPLCEIGRNGGPLRPEYTVKYVVIPILFLLSGLKLPTRDLLHSVMQFKLHLFCQLWIFVAFPVFMYTFALVMRYSLNINRYLTDGLVMLGCFPTTTTTCVVLTRSADGNEGACLFNATVSNLLGIVVSPALLLLFLGTSGNIPFLSVALTLVLTVLIPVLVGQVIQNVLVKLKWKWTLEKIPGGAITTAILLFVVFTVISDVFCSGGGNMDAKAAVIVGVLLIICHGLLLSANLLVTGIPRLFHFTRKDRIALLFACSQKTIGLGIPLINILFEGDPNIHLVYLPVLIYHPCQLVMGSIAVHPLKTWCSKDPSLKDSAAVELQEITDTTESNNTT